MNSRLYCRYFLGIALSPFALLSCSGNSMQANSTTITNIQPLPAPGDTVSALGENLWIMHQDRRGDYWFGSNSEGLFRLSHGKGKKNIILHYHTKHGLTHNRINQIQEDEGGNLYFSTQDGICKFDGMKFMRLNESTASVQRPEWKLEKNDLWFPGPQGHVYRYDGDYLHKLPLPKNSLEKVFKDKYSNAPYSPYDQYTIYKDKNGFIWFGTGNLGACRWDGHSFAWISDDEVTELTDGPSCGVRSVFVDEDDMIWIGSTLYKYEISPEGTFAGIQYKIEQKEGLSPDQIPSQKEVTCIFSITAGDNGDIWFVTYNDGVWKYDGKTVVHYPVTENGVSVTLYSMYRDLSGAFWVGTHEHGVFRLNEDKFERFRPAME